MTPQNRSDEIKSKNLAMECGETIVDWYQMHYSFYANSIKSDEIKSKLVISFAECCYENDIDHMLCMRALKHGVDSRAKAPQGRKDFLDDVVYIRSLDRVDKGQEELINKRTGRQEGSAFTNVLDGLGKTNSRNKQWVDAIKESLASGKFDDLRVAEIVNYPIEKMKSAVKWVK